MSRNGTGSSEPPTTGTSCVKFSLASEASEALDGSTAAVSAATTLLDATARTVDHITAATRARSTGSRTRFHGTQSDGWILSVCTVLWLCLRSLAGDRSAGGRPRRCEEQCARRVVRRRRTLNLVRSLVVHRDGLRTWALRRSVDRRTAAQRRSSFVRRILSH